MLQVLIRKMSYVHLFKELSDFEKEELQLKVKRNTEYDDILRLFASIPVHPLWPLSIFHAESCYANNYETVFANYLQYNAWRQLDEIGIPYHSCTEKILKYEVEGKPIKCPNLHFFPQFCFVELEKRSLDPFTYIPSTSPALWPKSQQDSKKERKAFWTPKGLNRKTRKRLWNNPRNQRQKGQKGVVTPFNLLDQNIIDLFANEGFTDILLFA